MCRVFGSGAGKGVGGVYVRRILGLYMLSDSVCSSFAFSFPLVFSPSAFVSDHAPFEGLLSASVLTSGMSREDVSPVEKKSGRVCCIMYIARPNNIPYTKYGTMTIVT